MADWVSYWIRTPSPARPPWSELVSPRFISSIHCTLVCNQLTRPRNLAWDLGKPWLLFLAFFFSFLVFFLSFSICLLVPEQRPLSMAHKKFSHFRAEIFTIALARPSFLWHILWYLPPPPSSPFCSPDPHFLLLVLLLRHPLPPSPSPPSSTFCHISVKKPLLLLLFLLLLLLLPLLWGRRCKHLCLRTTRFGTD